MQEIIILTKSLGEKRFETDLFVKFLLGRKTDEILAAKLNLDPYFGIFSHLEFKSVKKILKQSEELGVIFFGNSICLTTYGKRCLESGKIVEKQSSESKKNEISEEESLEIKKYSEFLAGLNLDQQKAIVCNSPKILCVAGAGSGKTTVLTKRIVHLVLNKNVNPSEILAITFTKKAKEHMEEKLSSLGITGCKVCTFNSFGEYLIRRSGQGGEIVSSSKKREIVEKAFEFLDIDFNEVVRDYFKEENKNKFILKNRFVNDCFVIRDYYNNLNLPVDEFYKKFTDVRIGEIVYRVILYVNAYFRKNNFYDYSDQLVYGLDLVRPREFSHVLVDEYQDINLIQDKLISKLDSSNLFCVGDPRQSIYGWRGSKIDFILKFSGEVIYLTKNYRSCEEIVNLGNKIISSMELPDLESNKTGGTVTLCRYETMKDEAISIVKKIKTSKFNLEDIFIIARTNNILKTIEEELDKSGIKYIVKNDEVNEEIHSGAVSLLTGHCAKGLEAKQVFVIGCTSRMFPCLKSEHRLLEFVKEYYNKREEERRLLYVAVTRAEEELHISYFGKSLSKFLKGQIKVVEEQTKLNDVNEVIKKRLFDIRSKISLQVKIPEYLIMSDSEIERISREEDITFKVLKKILGSRANKYGDLIMEGI